MEALALKQSVHVRTEGARRNPEKRRDLLVGITRKSPGYVLN